jgi:hypothetical protein
MRIIHQSLPFKNSLPKDIGIRFLFASNWLSRKPLLSTINLSNVAEKIEDTARVTPFVVVPRNQLDEVVVEGDTSLGIEDGGVSVTVKISGDDLVLSVSEDA